MRRWMIVSGTVSVLISIFLLGAMLISRMAYFSFLVSFEIPFPPTIKVFALSTAAGITGFAAGISSRGLLSLLLCIANAAAAVVSLHASETFAYFRCLIPWYVICSLIALFAWMGGDSAESAPVKKPEAGRNTRIDSLPPVWNVERDAVREYFREEKDTGLNEG